MRLIYGRGVLMDLDVTDPTDYGFDTFQLANYNNDMPRSDISSEITNMDGYFTDGNDFILSYTPLHDLEMGNGGGEEGIDSIQRDGWYDSPSSPFYADMDSLFDWVHSEYGSRFKGMRWNHEHRPRQFKEGPKWRAYAQEHDPENYALAQSTDASKWLFYRENIAGSHARDAYENIGRALESPYDSTSYNAVKHLYRTFVDFQCQAQARMFDILAQKLVSSRKLIVYAVQRSPIVYSQSEYAVDFREVTHSGVIGEIGTWDLIAQTNAHRNGWAQQQGTKPYFFALQQGGDNTHSSSHENHISNRANRMNSIVSTCLDPDGASDPWSGSFTFWSDWRDRNGRRGSPEITLPEQRDYMNQIRNALD